jgi:hypothetical protein
LPLQDVSRTRAEKKAIKNGNRKKKFDINEQVNNKKRAIDTYGCRANRRERL